MTILIDADGCPVVDLTLQIAKRFCVPVIILCDTSHQIEREDAQTLVFDKGADSVDFALVNRVKPGDVVVTQDYGLASMCLAKCARVLNQNGLEYTADNIDALMLRRYENKKLLRAGTCGAHRHRPGIARPLRRGANPSGRRRDPSVPGLPAKWIQSLQNIGHPAQTVKFI